MAKPKAIRSVTESKHVSMCVYGDPGVGKTRLIGTLGARTLILRPPTDHTDSILDSSVKEWVIKDWSEFDEAYEYLRLEGAKDWDWVWLDSISLFQDHGLDDIWESVLEKKPHRAEYDLDKGEYGINMARLSRYIRHFVGMDAFNFGVTAHPTPFEMPDGEEKLMPYVQGKNMAPKICGYMNMVLYYELRRKKDGTLYRVLRSEASDQFYAKDQFTALSKGRLVDPTMPKVIEAIEAARGGRGNRTKRRSAPRRKTTTRKR